MDGNPPLSLGVFLTYRREDSAGHAGRLFDALRQHSDAYRIFMDVDGIGAGDDFRHSIERALASCDVVIALIGPRWVDARDDRGKRRLTSPEDFVRLEIETALRWDMTVIPVLIDGADMPTTDELPESMTELTHKQAIEVSNERFHYDVGRLMKSLDRLEGHKVGKAWPDSEVRSGAGSVTTRGEASQGTEPAPPSRPKSRIPVLTLLAAVVLLGMGAGLVWLISRGSTGAEPRGLDQIGQQTGAGTEDPSLADEPINAPSIIVPQGEPVRLPVTSVSATSTSEPGEDACGKRVPFDAAQVSDGAEATAWRTPGMGRGVSLQLTFRGRVQVTRVGLLPGYAKVDPCDGTNRFTENRIIRAVRYDFSDGSSSVQRFSPLAEIQYSDVEAVTDSMVVTILAAGPHGGRDFAAISEIEVYGYPFS